MVFSSTYTSTNEGGEDHFNSILAFFGYPNGTDETLNISKYFDNINPFEEDDEHNLYKYLMNNIILENNIL